MGMALAPTAGSSSPSVSRWAIQPGSLLACIARDYDTMGICDMLHDADPGNGSSPDVNKLNPSHGGRTASRNTGARQRRRPWEAQKFGLAVRVALANGTVECPGVRQ